VASPDLPVRLTGAKIASLFHNDNHLDGYRIELIDKSGR
jgi:hypothetical protein